RQMGNLCHQAFNLLGISEASTASPTPAISTPAGRLPLTNRIADVPTEPATTARFQFSMQSLANSDCKPDERCAALYCTGPFVGRKDGKVSVCVACICDYCWAVHFRCRPDQTAVA